MDYFFLNLMSFCLEKCFAFFEIRYLSFYFLPPESFALGDKKLLRVFSQLHECCILR